MNYLYGKYFQKSLNYLFPLLGMRREEAFEPTGTYLWWSGKESIDNQQLIVGYEEKDRILFEPFEKKMLFKNPYFECCYDVENGRIYVFDISSYGDTVKKFMEGRYSQFSEGIKKKILNYHGASVDKVARPGRYIHMSLYPELYWEQVARELNGFSVETLEQVHELTDPFDKKQETLEIKIIGKCENFPVAL